jgi:hypothetical protein
MNEDIIKEIDQKAINIRGDIYAMIHNGQMVILEKINVYGAGYRTIISFGYGDFEKLKKLSDNPFGTNNE